MPAKASYDQLEQRIRELEQEEAKAKLNQRASTEQVQMLSQIIQASPTPTFVIDTHHTIILCNKAYEKLLGVAADDIVGRPRQWLEAESRDTPYMADFIVESAPEEEMVWYYGRKCRKSHVAEGAYEAEAFFPKLGDRGSWLLLTAAPLKDAGGNLIGAVETLQDVTERRLAEEGLRESEKRLAQIVQGSSIPTFVINEQHILTHCNRAYENLTKLSAGSILGTRAYWMTFYAKERPVLADFIVDRASEEEMRKYYGQSLRRSEAIEGAYEAENFFPDLADKGKWLFYTAAPIIDDDGRVTGAIETLQDITERKKSEEALPTLSSSSAWKATCPTSTPRLPKFSGGP